MEDGTRKSEREDAREEAREGVKEDAREDAREDVEVQVEDSQGGQTLMQERMKVSLSFSLVLIDN